VADVLAGEAPANNVNGNAICREPFGSKGSDVVENRDIWPVPGEDTSAIGIDFAEGDGSHSGPLEPEAESSDAGKEVEHIHLAPQKTSVISAKFSIWITASPILFDQ